MMNETERYRQQLLTTAWSDPTSLYAPTITGSSIPLQPTNRRNEDNAHLTIQSHSDEINVQQANLSAEGHPITHTVQPTFHPPAQPPMNNSNFTIMTWNCGGLNSLKWQTLIAHLQQHHTDIVNLIDTQITVSQAIQMKKQFREHVHAGAILICIPPFVSGPYSIGGQIIIFSNRLSHVSNKALVPYG
jgi:hypothetical protein